MRQRVIALGAALILALTPMVTTAQGTCALAPVFEPIRETVGAEIVGECSGNPSETPAGDLTQATTRGLLMQRKADGVTMFSNDTTTWLAGPEGLQSRGKDERLTWEPPTDAPAVAESVPAAPPAPASAPPPSPPNPTAAYGQRCSDIIASTPNRGGPSIDQQWGICVNLGEQYGPKGVDCYAKATKDTAKYLGKISTELQTTMFDATLDACKASIR